MEYIASHFPALHFDSFGLESPTSTSTSIFICVVMYLLLYNYFLVNIEISKILMFNQIYRVWFYCNFFSF